MLKSLFNIKYSSPQNIYFVVQHVTSMIFSAEHKHGRSCFCPYNEIQWGAQLSGSSVLMHV